MPDYAPDEIPRRLPRRVAGALVRLGAIGAAMLCAAATFAYAGGWLPASRLTAGRLAGGHIALAWMTTAFDDAGPGHAEFRGTRGACGTGLFESAGQATALSRADEPVTSRGMVSHIPPPARGHWRTGIDGIAMSAGNSAQGFYDRLMAPAPDPAIAKPDPARIDLFPSRHAGAAIALVMKRPAFAGFAPGEPCTDVD